MKILHVGPLLARVGGPAGYLQQLEAASRGRDSGKHHVFFPQQEAQRVPEPAATVLARARRRLARLRVSLRHLKRTLIGAPQFYRPSEVSLRSRLGVLHQNITSTGAESTATAQESMASGLDLAGVNAFFAHDPFCAEYLLERRHGDQQVWLMCHAPMPIALYLAWSWGIPEWDWRDVVELPDVRSWIDWEIGVCERVDSLVLPCEEAGEELVRVDRRFARVLSRARFLLTGAAAPPPAALQSDRSKLRHRWNVPLDARVGLYLGNAQPYRGLDALLGSIGLLPAAGSLPGIVAVAGPAPDLISSRGRVRPLGRVDDVAGLLRAVDFVVNVNRFSLFDLSTIEAVEAGKPLLLHEVGGNKTFRDLGAGCVMVADLEPQTVATGLQQMFAMSVERLRGLGQASRNCYETWLTPGHLWGRHLQLYDELSTARTNRTACA